MVGYKRGKFLNAPLTPSGPRFCCASGNRKQLMFAHMFTGIKGKHEQLTEETIKNN